jgi:hypothetical protein
LKKNVTKTIVENLRLEISKRDMIRKILQMLWPCALLFGCTPNPFTLEFPDRTNLIHTESGLYVHREIELRVNAARFEFPPDGAAPGAVSELNPSHFFALGVSSANFIRSKYERRGDDLVWREVIHLSKDDVKGKTSLGVCVRWEKDGAVTVSDAMEIFPWPQPEMSQMDTWSPWVTASSSREGIFAWHAEANKHETETVTAPAYPFQMRFRLVLSQIMYP